MDQAVTVTERSYEENNREYVEESLISAAYSLVSRSINSEVLLLNPQGKLICSSDIGVDPDHLVERTSSIKPAIANKVLTDGIYKELGTLGGYFKTAHYIVAKPVRSDGKPFGLVLTACPADDLVDFLKELVKMFLVSATVVLALVFFVIYFITAKLVNPLKIMLDATNSFTRGDFSKRVPVSGYDEIGQLSMAFNNMASTLASTESSRRSFVANVSHELKTPMTTISGFVDGILDGTVPEEKIEQYLRIVSTECKRLSRLVRSMLDTARLEAGELDLVIITFDISEIIRQTVFTFESTIDKKRIDIRGLEIDRIMVNADKDLMHQVVYNLIENAVKFARKDGYIEFSYRYSHGFTYVSVKNSGDGIDKQEADHLFERFYKSDRSRGLNKDGVGLGLHIVKSILKYHRGDITVESELGEYTVFEFSVPSASVPPKEDNI